MKLYIEFVIMLFRKVILRQNTGTVIRKFCEKMGIVYIKFAQILATQNYGNIFTESDREKLSKICDNCNVIKFEEIEEILKEEYGDNLYKVFESIEEKEIGSASVSQVHKGILKNGKEVAIKIKRKDVVENIEKEVRRLKKIVRRFGKLIKFSNYSGGDNALDLFAEWIRQETDFDHERKNIISYKKFADSVNGKVENTKKIRVPKLYKEYCTKNVIVMEYIKYETINKMEMSEENYKKIIKGINSYLKLSFYALLNGKQIIFHGDPHGGNIYIDDRGDIGFLDMGLIFILSEDDSILTRNLFLAAYSGNSEKLFTLISNLGHMDGKTKAMFKEECKKYCSEVNGKNITNYFTDMINMCLKFEFVPPNFLFCMAKAFVCLNGIVKFSDNKINASELLGEQVMEYLLKRSLEDYKNTVFDSIKGAPKIVEEVLKYGIEKTFIKEASGENGVKHALGTMLNNVEEMLKIMKISYLRK